MTAGPATQPSWPMAHASDNTPDPITAVMMCALAVHTEPKKQKHSLQCQNYYYLINATSR